LAIWAATKTLRFHSRGTPWL